ncbi:thiamine biosynthesis protein ThiJ [Zobellella endophytica]|uniref:Thiamine biosynthesis protein ThiJ n=2 Tax=Zobellella endophytica TaxID=2116700 RepID=A0A2P7R997_9GAMM|nr:thiamine biosynthesis protein ThiJ [Zobellella endophytica]
MSVTREAPDVSGPLKGRIGVVVESHFDELELVKFQEFFPANGYEVVFMSYLWDQPELTFTGNDFTHQVVVNTDITKVDLSEFDGIILIGGYAMDRLRYETKVNPDGTSSAPAVDFIRKVIETDRIKVGTICHSLWLLTAAPDLLSGKKVTAAHNILADVRNAGGIIQIVDNQAVDTFVDGHLISGKHPEVVDEFMQVYLSEIEKDN